MLKTSHFSSNRKICVNFYNVFQQKFSTENKIKQSVKNEVDSELNNVKSFESIPGPKPVPIFGSLWHAFPYVGKYYGLELHKAHIQYQKDYGNIVRLRELKFVGDLLLCYDPKDIETIYRNEGPWPDRGDVLPSVRYYRQRRPDVFQGYGGVFTTDGEEWQEARTIMNSLLMQPRVVKHYINGFSTVADDFVERIKYLSSQNSINEMPEDFHREIMKWTLESIGVLSLDTRFGLLENGELDPEKLNYITNANQLFDILFKIDIMPSLSKIFSTPTWKKYIQVMDEIVYFIQKQIKLTKERIEKEGVQKEENEMSIIEKMIKKYDHKYIFGNVLDLIVAGVDTTSRSMLAILYLLASNPEKQEILRKEVNEILTNPNDVLTIQKLEKMPYLRAVIKESMRISPIGIGWSRVTTKDLVLSGYHVPKGTQVIMEQMPLFWSDEHFPEANQFIPERWLRNDKKVQDINPWVLLPFGFGPRSCVGRRIAQLELEVLLTKIIKNFKMEWHHGEPEFALKLLFGIVSPLKIRMMTINN